MVFGGCSFTWGQGLYYYSNLPTLKEPPPDQYKSELVSKAHLRYMETVRYPRLVANHFNTWELVAPGNGGSNLSIVNWWTGKFTNDGSITTGPVNEIPVKEHDFSEVSHFVFQLTQYQRDNFIIDFNGEQYNVPLPEVSLEPLQTKFLKWIAEKNLTYDEWEINYKRENVTRVFNFLKTLENNGIKTYVLAWPGNYLNFVRENQFLNDRLITFNYKGTVYDNIELMMKQNRELEIKYDYENFVEPPKDHHPSLKCHQVIADNIIKVIEKK